MILTPVDIHRAIDMAVMAHGDQRYGKYPYAAHLADVDNIVQNHFGEDQGQAVMQLRCAAWLHDTLEDTDLTYETIRTSFGQAVADMVADVTGAKGMPRKVRTAHTIAVLKHAPANSVNLKLADRLANMRACVSESMMNLGFLYALEYPQYRIALYTRGHRQLWASLDDAYAALGGT